MRPRLRFGWAAWALLLFVALRIPAALAAAPAFHVVELGAGSPIAVNSSGTVVGIEGTSASPQPWIVRNGVRSALPLPAGATYAMANAVSESGVAAGHVSGKPVLWLPDASGYTAQWIALPTGVGPAAQPVGVRDTPNGPLVLLNTGYPGLFASPTWLYFGVSVPYLYQQASGFVNLVGAYGLSSPFTAADMTAQGRILASDGRIFNPDGSVTAAPPPRVSGYWTGWNAMRLNQKGEMVAIASLATSDGHAEIARWSPTSGWFVIETFIGAMYPYSADGISEAGDAISTQYGGHMLTTAAGERLALHALLIESGYALTGSGGAMADDGRIVMVGRNPSNVARALRLDPGGVVPPPAPVTLTGVAHPATASAPWTAISLSWTASPGASAYIVERKGPTDAGFIALTPTSGTIQLKWDDTTVAPQTLYSYRVIARGVGGNGEPSNVVSVLSPPAKDSVAPSARITSPASGANVVGPITVGAEASDNVGLRGFEIRVQPNMGSEVLCSRSYATAKLSDTLACSWDPGYLAAGASAQLIAYAWDEVGNYVMNPITVTYRGSTTTDTAAPKVSVQSPANNATVGGLVSIVASATDNVGVVRMEVRDPAGALIGSASGDRITAAWDTGGMRKGSRQTITVRAFDAAGNVGSVRVTVRIGR